MLQKGCQVGRPHVFESPRQRCAVPLVVHCSPTHPLRPGCFLSRTVASSHLLDVPSCARELVLSGVELTASARLSVIEVIEDGISCPSSAAVTVFLDSPEAQP